LSVLPVRIVAIALVCLIAAGCQSIVVDGRNVDRTSWRATMILGQAPGVDSAPTLSFEGASIRGSAGCNSYSLEVSIEFGVFKAGEGLKTLGACVGPNGDEQPVMAIECAYYGALTTSTAITFRGDALVISGPRGDLIFERMP
jgi:heat shock protein HslJ